VGKPLLFHENDLPTEADFPPNVFTFCPDQDPGLSETGARKKAEGSQVLMYF
jgi:hypothetical protein